MNLIKRRVKMLEDGAARTASSGDAHLVLLQPGDDLETETKRQAPDYREGDELMIVCFVSASDKNQAVQR